MIEKRLADIGADDVFDALALRILDALSWEDFWHSIDAAGATKPALKRDQVP